MSDAGFRSGLLLTFYPSGQLKRQTIIADGKPVGTSRVFRPNGSILLEEIVLPGGESTRRRFYQDGKIEHELRLMNDKLMYEARYDEKGLRYQERRY